MNLLKINIIWCSNFSQIDETRIGDGHSKKTCRVKVLLTVLLLVVPAGYCKLN